MRNQKLHIFNRDTSAMKGALIDHFFIQNLNLNLNSARSLITSHPKMPLPPSKKQLVLITGVKGYIASQNASSFLYAGCSVRGIVRSLSSSPYPICRRQSLLNRRSSSYHRSWGFRWIYPGHSCNSPHGISHLFLFADPEPMIRSAVGVLDGAKAFERYL